MLVCFNFTQNRKKIDSLNFLSISIVQLRHKQDLYRNQEAASIIINAPKCLHNSWFLESGSASKRIDEHGAKMISV